MKVVHINTTVKKSSAVCRLHLALLKAGIDSYIVSREFDEGIPNAIVVGKGNIIERIGRKIDKEIAKTSTKFKLKNYPFNFSLHGQDITKTSIIADADIIHIHWICGFLSPRNIDSLYNMGKKIIWTCHDIWPFTGGCHVEYECDKYQRGCGQCPFLKRSRIDYAKIVYREKEKYLKRIPITFACPSEWIKEMLLKSFLFKKNNVYVIKNPVDTEVFKPLNNGKKDKGKINILFGATSSSIPYKGFRYLEEVLDTIYKKNPELASQIVINIVGNYDVKTDTISNYEKRVRGFITDPEDMAHVYQDVDVLVYPSMGDNLPGIVMESLACETPVVAFDTGGIGEMIEHKKNGYLAERGDADSLYEGLMWVINNNTNNILGKNGRERIVEDCSDICIANQFIDLYKKILSE